MKSNTATTPPAVRAKKRDAELVDLRREQIFHAAAVVFAEKGYHKATVQDVADAAGLGKGTIYEYVKSKKELLLLVVEEGHKLFFEQIKQAVESENDPERQLRLVIHEALTVVEQHRTVARTLLPLILGLDEKDNAGLIRNKFKIIELCEQVFKRGVAAKIFRPVPSAAAVEILLNTCWYWAQSETISNYVTGVDDFEVILCEMFFGGILLRVGGKDEV